MSFRFFRRVKIAPGLTVNFSKGGASLSAGVRGARITMGKTGLRKTVGLPGSGLYYTEHKSWSKGEKSNGPPPPTRAEKAAKLTLGFFDRLFVSKEEQAFVDGCKAHVEENSKQALNHLSKAKKIADAMFLAGFLSCSAKDFNSAEKYLQIALKQNAKLGQTFEKYKISMTLLLQITEEVCAHITPCKRGVLLGLVEIYQERKEHQKAIDYLWELHKNAPDDVVVKLSLAELVLEAEPNNQTLAKELLDIIGNVENESNIHAALMFYKAQALQVLGLQTAARDTLTAAGRKKKDRSEDLLLTIQYKRALVYEAMGQKARARAEFEKIYLKNHNYKDIVKQLGV